MPRLDELDVDLHVVAGALLFVALPTASCHLQRWEAGSRPLSKRSRMRRTPDLPICMSW